MIDVSKLNAGPELDALIAEKVMGWRRSESSRWIDTNGNPTTYQSREGSNCRFEFRPSTDIAAAWEVVEKLSDRFMASINQAHYRAKEGVVRDGRWEVRFSSLDPASRAFGLSELCLSTPLAICRAALRAVGV